MPPDVALGQVRQVGTPGAASGAGGAVNASEQIIVEGHEYFRHRTRIFQISEVRKLATVPVGSAKDKHGDGCDGRDCQDHQQDHDTQADQGSTHEEERPDEEDRQVFSDAFFVAGSVHISPRSGLRTR